jgi:hypothetical protein
LRRHRPVGPPIEPSGQRFDGIRIGGPHSATSHSGSPGPAGPLDALPEVESGALGGSAGGPALEDDVGRPHAAARQVSATSAAIDAIRASRAASGMPQRSAAARRRHHAVGRITGDPSPAAWLLRIRVDQMTRQPRRATLGPRYPGAARSEADPTPGDTMTAAMPQPCGCTA